MKKKNCDTVFKYIILISFVLLLALLLVLFGALYFVGFFKTVTLVGDIPQGFHIANDNNYVENNRFDANETYIGFITEHGFFTKLTILKDTESVYTVYNTHYKFRLVEDKLVYLKDNTLYFVDLLSKKKTKVSNSVRKFALWQGDIVYIDSARDQLIIYDFDTKKSVLVESGVNRFSLLGNDAYIIPLGAHSSFCKKSLLHGTETTIFSHELVVESWNNRYFRKCGEEIVWIDGRSLMFSNLDTGVSRETQILPDNFSQVYYQWYTIDNNYAYVSLQKYYNYDHLLLLLQEDESNGLWRVNVETLKKEKVSDVRYTSLAYFGDHLVGTFENELYIIDTETFEATKLIEWK